MSTIEPSETSWSESNEEIPVVDLGPLSRNEPGALERLGEQVRQAFGTLGFLYITNHGVPQQLIDRVFEENARFHALPLDEKCKVIARSGSNENTFDGYLPSGVQRVKTFDLKTGRAGKHDNAKADVGEAFFMSPSLRADRSGEKWPEDLPGFQQTLVEYYDALHDLCYRLLPIIAVSMRMPPDFFLPFFAKQESRVQLRLSHYPTDPLEEHQYNTSPHCDGSFITLLAQSEVPGLQIFRKSGEWLPAPVRRGDFLVNSAELLRLWSNDSLLSTPHRVINASGRDRYAIPFFYSPRLDTLIECLPTCHDADHPVRHQPITAGEYLVWFMKENFAGTYR